MKKEGKEEGRRRGRNIEYLKGTKVLSLNYYLRINFAACFRLLITCTPSMPAVSDAIGAR